MYPGHLIPASPEMLEELLRRSLELELFMHDRVAGVLIHYRKRAA
jgi:hypothetical protein